MTPERRDRTGWVAHGGRGLSDASELAPELREALDLIPDDYAVEHHVEAAGKFRSPERRQPRTAGSRDAMDR